ncbi:MAG: hypothetical protein N0E55_02120 [Candidatus Thiodiazotropha taylori]|nr:hypothetical protein [Candidatus Thiodiazotropha taylori]MCG8092606.1 hypothetical protein [Candidatus Thiodiazotropha endolucinida]MCG8109519.1 hypothetical protein [Candidatus Thiodiazotropha taylori]MCG8122750.1 hypothetical protein [Candidatus Thiodiazotropha taylori]MCW4251482.1 hypothetical protein [Candidatus Thiodiazotropha taylori]
MSLLPSHGRIKCRNCFSTEENTQESTQWRITNDPGAWGSNNPRFLVLGFSKGFTQANAYKEGSFDAVAFAKFRPRLQNVLMRLGLLSGERDINTLMTAKEDQWAFGSLVRCSLCRKNSKNGEWAATGPLMKKAFVEVPAADYVSNCSEKFLTSLPDRLKVVVILGNDDGYVKHVSSVIRKLYHEDFERVNDMAYKCGGVIWIHAAHPSGSNGHLRAWLDASSDKKQGIKAVQAIAAVNMAL